MKKMNWKGMLAAAMILTVLCMALYEKNENAPEKVTYPEFLKKAENGEILTVTMGNGADWKSVLKDGKVILSPNPRTDDSKEKLLMLGIDVREEESSTVPQILLGGMALAALLLFFRMRKTGETGMMKYAAVQTDEKIPDTTFEDVAVNEETLRAMKDLVDFLKKPEIFRRLGARSPKGVMLYGPPGTGKTLLARALAGEAKAPFFAMSGADFVQVYVGVGASRVRELFKKARKAGGGVIFIDEIDAIGKKRDNGNDEREQTLNALLTEMSGFSGGDGIIVLAATNRIDTLDTALLREGRFDRRIEVGLPDQEQRERILRVHAKNKPLDNRVNLCELARQTSLFSGAQLETLLNEAAIRSARKGLDKIGPSEIDEAFFAVAAGEDTPRMISPEEKKITAYHEAGHALVTKLLMPKTDIKRVTIIPSSRGAAGYSMSVQEEKILHTKKDVFAMICAALAGRTAEEMVFGPENVTTGASGDLSRAREIAAHMAGEWGMGETGEKEKDQRIIWQRAMESTRQCLLTHEDALHRLAQALLEKETLNGQETAEAIGVK